MSTGAVPSPAREGVGDRDGEPVGSNCARAGDAETMEAVAELPAGAGLSSTHADNAAEPVSPPHKARFTAATPTGGCTGSSRG